MEKIIFQEKIDLGLPPKELVIADFHDLLDNINLRTSEINRKLYLMQTIQGHANMADGMFRIHEDKMECTKYPNTMLDDIAPILAKDPSLKMSPTKVKNKRLENIMDIKKFLEKIIKGEKVKKLQNSKGEPLLGNPFFKDITIKNPLNILRGFYLGSIMDNYTLWRKQIREEPYNLEMGGGKCVAVDIRKVNQKTFNEMMKNDEKLAMKLLAKATFGFNLGILANEEWEDHIDLLYEHGIIVDKEVVKATKHMKNAYVRYKRGKGVSDNAAIVMAGIFYGQKDRQDGVETAIGVFMADAVDTLDKYVPNIHKDGLDEIIGREVIKSGKLNITKKEKLNFIFFSAIHPRKHMPDCSQRYFLQVDEQTSDTAIENHLTYLKGDKPKKMILGHNAFKVGVKSEDFYQTIEDKLVKYSHLL